MTTLPQTMRSAEKDVRSKSIFELSAQEMADRLCPTADSVMCDTFNRKGFLTYFDNAVCPDTSYMVHEYRDRKELVRIDDQGTAHLIKIF